MTDELLRSSPGLGAELPEQRSPENPASHRAGRATENPADRTQKQPTEERTGPSAGHRAQNASTDRPDYAADHAPDALRLDAELVEQLGQETLRLGSVRFAATGLPWMRLNAAGLARMRFPAAATAAEDAAVATMRFRPSTLVSVQHQIRVHFVAQVASLTSQPGATPRVDPPLHANIRKLPGQQQGVVEMRRRLPPRAVATLISDRMKLRDTEIPAVFRAEEPREGMERVEAPPFGRPARPPNLLQPAPTRRRSVLSPSETLTAAPGKTVVLLLRPAHVLGLASLLLESPQPAKKTSSALLRKHGLRKHRGPETATAQHPGSPPVRLCSEPLPA